MPKQYIEYLNHIPKAIKHLKHDLYTSPEYLSVSPFEIINYCAYDKKSQEIMATISFQLKETAAVSLINAPFGGFSLSPDCDIDIIKELLLFVISDLDKLKLNAIVIKLAAPFYRESNHQYLLDILSSFHFRINNIEINHHIKISESSLEVKMNNMEKRKLRKCTATDFKFNIEPDTSLAAIYNFIAECRAEKKQSLSMSLLELEDAVSINSKSYILFSLKDKGEIIAASICVVVNRKVLYNFYPASNYSYNSYSPMVYLLSNIYKYCQENEFQYLDLGTSMHENLPNQSLIQFKKGMGGIQSEKITYKYSIK